MLTGLGSDLEYRLLGASGRNAIFFYTIEDFNISKSGLKPRSVECFHGMMPQFWGSLSASPPHVWGTGIAKRTQSGGSFLPSSHNSVKPKAEQSVNSRSPRTGQTTVKKRTGRLICLGKLPRFHWKLVKNENSFVEHCDFNEWHTLMKKCFIRNFLARLFSVGNRWCYFYGVFLILIFHSHMVW